MRTKRILSSSFFLCLFFVQGFAQKDFTDPIEQAAISNNVKFFSLEPASSFNKKRFWTGAGTGFGLWAGASVAMWQAWYKDFPITGFHTFDDSKEWRGMDKFGHAQAAYAHSYYTFKGARWTGMDRRKAMWTGIGVALGIQSTVEIMDGFSEEWGFSVTDMAFNVLGAGTFAAQELLWKEQRILIKVSSTRPRYPNLPIYSVEGGQETSLRERADELFGSTPSEVFLKDYNAMTIWASFNVKSFAKKKENNRFPEWLNLALGIGAGNIYGGFRNEWTGVDGGGFVLNGDEFPRYTQMFLAPDIDFSRIPARQKWLKILLTTLNWVKLPSPVMEVNTQGEVKFRPIYW